jgi:hypothetical protein
MSSLAHASLVDGALLGWFSLTAIGLLYTGWDIRSTPELRVMKLGWLLVILFTGPVGAALYVLACKEPLQGTHKDFIRPLWKQALGSTIHCIAGDATGIILAAVVTSRLGFPMWLDFITEYAFGFAVGLLVFQALFMRDMVGGSYLRALRLSFIPEFLSMNLVMAGILMTRHMSAMHPTSLRFWGVMSLATLVGLVVAYPVNVWLVYAKLKHGMGTVRALGAGGHSLGAEAGHPEPDKASPAGATPEMAL